MEVVYNQMEYLRLRAQPQSKFESGVQWVFLGNGLDDLCSVASFKQQGGGVRCGVSLNTWPMAINLQALGSETIIRTIRSYMA